MSALLCVLATAAAAPTEAAMGEAYARLVNVTGNQQLWAERAEVSEPVAVMDRFEDRARRAAEEAPATLMAMNPAPASRTRPSAPRPAPTTAPAAASALSVEDLIQTYDGSVAENVPLPGARSVALGYAPAASSASSQAFRHLLSPVPANGETIEIGAIEDTDAFVRVADLLVSYASATEEGSDGQTVTLRPGQDADGLLRRLWSAGATDAFVIRD